MNKSMLSVRDAHARVIAAFEVLPSETISVADATGRVLATAPSARLTQPPSDLSAMDGYAVRAEDVPATPTTLTLVGEAPAGGSYDHALKPGETVRNRARGSSSPFALRYPSAENCAAKNPASRHGTAVPTATRSTPGSSVMRRIASL